MRHRALLLAPSASLTPNSLMRLGNRPGGHAGNPDRAEQQPDGGERQHQGGPEFLRRERIGQERVERLDAIEGEHRIDARHRIAQRPGGVD